MLSEKFFNNNCHSVNQYIPDYQNQKDHHYLQKNNDSNVFDFYNRPNYFDNLNSQIVEPKKIYKNDALSVHPLYETKNNEYRYQSNYSIQPNLIPHNKNQNSILKVHIST